MSRFIRELFQGSSYRQHPRYYYDDAVVSYGAGRSVLPDVVLSVPMESMRDVERVKQALAIEGVHRVRCDLASQTVVVSGNVPPSSLLRRVKWIKRHSSIMSYGAPYGGSSYEPEYTAYNPYALQRYPSGNVYENRRGALEYGSEYGSAEYGSPYERPYSSYSYY
jgi:hypothetical protein